MRRLALLASVASLLCGPAWAEDNNIAVYTIRADNCGKVLALESLITRRVESANGRMTIRNDERINYERFQEASGYIAGYLTALNLENWRHGGNGDLFKINIHTDVWPWVLSWCRANPTRDIYNAVSDITQTIAGNRP
jgi:hypothetical protein